MVSIQCLSCGEVFYFSITEEQAKDLQEGEKYIQDILSNFSPGDREMFISQICPRCFDMLFE